jgi:hypothetical protein
MRSCGIQRSSKAEGERREIGGGGVGGGEGGAEEKERRPREKKERERERKGKRSRQDDNEPWALEQWENETAQHILI